MSQNFVEFSQFTISLAQSVLVGLGEVAETEGVAPQKNVEAAKHGFGVLQMLHKKTKGNLSEEEQKLIEALLRELTPKINQLVALK